jgi:tetratricopeptide (TPR) repeat protein
MNSGKYRVLIAAALFALALWPTSFAIAQTNEAAELNQTIDELYQAGRYAEAIPLALKVLDIQEKALGPDHPAVAIALDRLADLYVKRHRYTEAEPLYKRAIEIYEQDFGPNSPRVAVALRNLGDFYAAEGRTAEAEALHARAAEILKQADRDGASLPSPAESHNWITASPSPPARTRGLTVPPAQAQSAIPIFPMPPPAASAKYVLPRDVFKDRSTIGQAVDAIIAALEKQDYVDRSFFATPAGGVALVTRLERINDDGTHAAETKRWPAAGGDQQFSSTLDLGRILRSLFFAEPGHYRIIVFILQNEAFSQSGTRITEEDAQAWLHKGLNVLPQEIRDRAFDKADCTALIYEFVNDGSGAHMVENSPLTGKQHLRMAGLQILLGDNR